MYFVLNAVTFVWNEEKARINPSNHDGITFQQATEAFFDPFVVVLVTQSEKSQIKLSSGSYLVVFEDSSIE
ncbi:hypothetical protein IQ276_030625 [Desmonostoc muscorum LEGE 12446]|nr:hypothetical protein [Desmonostoc muscorum LEGE 12446]